MTLKMWKISSSVPAVPRLLLGLAILPIIGCASDLPSTGDIAEKDVVDVAPSLDIPIEDDIQAVPRKVDLSGIMPSTFPKSLPLAPGSSLVNFGDDDGVAWVDLMVTGSPTKVESGLRHKLRAAGWSATPSNGALTLARSGLKARLLIRDGNPGTLYRYEY